MRIAVNYGEKGRIFEHFGHTKMFRIYNVNEENQVSSISMLDVGEASCCALADLLSSNNIDVLICGNIGPNAINRLTQNNIKVINGINDDCDVAVAKFLASKFEFSLEANCKHEQDKVERHSCHSHHHDCEECD